MSAEPFTWTPERVAFVRKRFHDGAPYRVIAAELGITRKAVERKCQRLDLRHGRPDKAPPLPAPAPSMPSTAILFIEARSNQCRFYVGTATGLNLMVCGAPKALTGSYCETCRKKAFNEDPRSISRDRRALKDARRVA